MKRIREGGDGLDHGHQSTQGVSPGKRSLSQSLPGTGAASAVQMSAAPAAAPIGTAVGDAPRSMWELAPLSSNVSFLDSIIGGSPDGSAVQRKESGVAEEEDVQNTAASGVQGPAGQLPFMDVIQKSFGEHDVSGVRSHVGGDAAEAARAIGAEAYATGNDVAFAGAPDLHTAAHEAAHVVQQRGGVQLKGGVGEAGDPYEQHADAVADKVVSGESAAALLDGALTGGAILDGATSTGPNVQRQATPDAPVTKDELQDALEKQQLINGYERLLAMKFESMQHGVQRTCSLLEKRTPKQTDLLGSMVNMAANAAIAGAAGVVAELVARRLAAEVADGFAAYRQMHQRFATDSLKEHLKKSFRVGSASAKGDAMDELKASFWDAQFKKIQAAQADFFSEFATHTGKAMAELPVEVLRTALERANQEARDPEIGDAASRNTAVEWANLVAQLHHGDGSWDPWAGPEGSEHATSTLDNAGDPRYSKDPTNHPSNNNVSPDSDSIRDLVDDDQRSLNPESHGILEIDLWGQGFDPGHGFREFELYTGSGFGMRLDGVSSHVKRMVAEFKRVGDLKMNKIVTLYSSRGANLSPPKPDGRFLITADGYIRRWTTDGDEAELAYASEFAQKLSPASIQ